MSTDAVEVQAQDTVKTQEAAAVSLPATPEMVKVSFNLPREEADTLRALAAKRGVTITQVLREAIADEALLRGEVDAGNKVVIQSSSEGTRRELLFR